MRPARSLQLLEFAVWVLAASAAIVGASLVLGLLIGQDLLTVKYVLFGVGFLLFGIGSLMIQPTRPQDRVDTGGDVGGTGGGGAGEGGVGGGLASGPPGGGNRGGGSGGDADDGGSDGRVQPDASVSTLRKRVQLQHNREHKYEARLQEVGPLADRELPFDQRIGRGPKIFVTSLVVLAVSFLLEVAGVQV